MTTPLAVYLPHDRRRTLRRGEAMPNRVHGTALFADISGFTPFTERLARQFGDRRGIEELTRWINAVYDAIIGAVERQGGSVISFAGDAITCWFDQAANGTTAAAMRAAACALAMQAAMRAFPDLSLKVAVTSGGARRFAVGDPHIQLLDTLAGETITRLSVAEQLAHNGEILADLATVNACGDTIQVQTWQTHAATNEVFAVIAAASPNHELPSAIALPGDDLSPDIIRPWVLPTVYTREQSGLGEFLTELRPAVALFLRFGGIDYDHDPAAHHRLDRFIQQVQRIIVRYDGTLLQLTIGDKGSYIYACFGAPTAHEDDARRAVNAALALFDLPRELTFLQPVQVGVSQGTLRVGAYGGASRRTYGALGDEVNIAARVMSLAAPGEILVTSRIQELMGDRFIVGPARSVAIKGKTDALTVFAVHGALRRRATRLHEPVYRLPIVGRQDELALIASKLELTRRRQGQIIGITAEAGMGKSRLVAEAIRLARQYGFAAYGGACESSGTNTPYLAWKPIWQAFFDVDPLTSTARQMDALAHDLQRRAPQRLQAMPLLAPLLDIPVRDNEFTRTLEPENRRSALEALLEDCVKATAADEALLFVLEDMHWIDPLSHDLLEALARASAHLPVCFVIAYRPVELARLQAPRVEALPHFTRIVVSELAPADAERLIHARFAQLYPECAVPPPGELVERLVARAQGNPFFLEELLNYLHDRGTDLWSLNGARLILDVPDSLHTLVLSRIDQLTETQKATLKVASIIGRFFPFAWLHGYYPALGTREAIKADLDEMARLDIVPLDSPEPELAYLFKHIVTQEVAYESLVYATRAQLHQQLAQYLEAYYAERLDLLAFHYGRSDHLLKQREYFRRAGVAAQAAYANAAALDYYERLLPLLSDPGEQIDIHLRRGMVLQLIGDWEGAGGAYRQALDLANRIPDPRGIARAHYALGDLCQRRGDYSIALNWLQQAHAGWQALGDLVEMGRTLVEIGFVHFREGAYAEARQLLAEGLAQARAARHNELTAQALSVLGQVALDQGDYETGRGSFEESLALQRAIGNRRGIATALNDLGLVAHAQGNLAMARALQEQSMAAYREIGDKHGIAAALINLGDATKEQGDLAAARAMFEEVLRLQHDMGYRLGAASALCNLGQVAGLQGDFAGARTAMEMSLTLFRDMGHKSGIVWVLGYFGEVVAGQGDYDAARATLEEGLALGREIGVKSYLARALCTLGSVALVQGDGAEAWALVDEGLALYREIGERSGVAWALNHLGFVALEAGNATAAHAAITESLALAQETGQTCTILHNLIALVELAALQRQPASRTAHLAGAGEALRITIGAAIEPARRQAYERAIAAARAALGGAAFDAVFDAGRRMTLDEALALARGEG